MLSGTSSEKPGTARSWRNRVLLVCLTPAIFVAADAAHSLATGYPLQELYVPILLRSLVVIAGLALAWLAVDRWIGERFDLDVLAAWPIFWVALVRISVLPFNPVTRNPIPVALVATIAAILVLAASRRNRSSGGFANVSSVHATLPVLLTVFFDSPTPVFLAAFAVAIGFALIPSRPTALRISGTLALLATLGLSLWNLHQEPVSTRVVSKFEPSSSAVGTPSESPEGVILIVLDTTRKDVIDFERVPSRIPHLTRLAREGIILDRCIANSPWTPPSHASMFTGLYPAQHGVTHTAALGNVHHLASDHETLAERLVAHSVRTGAFVANAYLKGFGILQGFQDHVYVSDEGAPALVEAHDKNLERLHNRFPDNQWLLRTYQFNRNPVVLAPEVFEDAAAWVRSVPDSEPFFLFINVMDQHYVRYLRAAGDLPARVGPKNYWEERADIMSDPAAYASRHEELHAWYRETMPYLDWAVGQFLDQLRDSGLYERSTIIVTSDHGNLFGEEGHYDHQTSVHNANLSIPMVVKYAANCSDRRPDRARVIQHVDVFAEILDLFDLEIPADNRGTPFPAPEGPLPLAYLYRLPPYDIDPSLEDVLDRDLLSTIVSLDGQEYQYVVASDAEQRLYRLDSSLQATGPDIFETFGERPELTKFLRLSPSLFRRTVTGEAAPVVDAETLELLKSLGYVN